MDRCAARGLTEQHYASGAAPRRSALPRLVVWTTLGAALFYGGSAAYSNVSEDYRDFFAERVPLGKWVLEHTDPSELSDEFRRLELDEKVSNAANAVRSGFGHVSDTLRDNPQVQQTREEVEKRAAELQERLGEQLAVLKTKAGDEARVVEERLAQLREESAQWLGQAKERSGDAAADVGDRAAATLEQVRDQTAAALGAADEEAKGSAGAAARGARSLAKDAKGAVKGAAGADSAGGDLPVNHESPAGYPAARERKLQAEENPRAVLRADPGAPKLPQLAPALSKLKGSEPMVAQLAGTIDELAAFVRETPSGGAAARGVLESAQADLEQLCARLDQIKQTDAKKLELQLAKQARDFEAEMARNADKAAGELSQRDKDWGEQIEELQRRQVAEFKGRLDRELEAQSAIINQRLREEVVARGVELQRKWQQQIHAKVEQERAGRLARLDELAGELRQLEEVSVANSAHLDDAYGMHALTAALRSVRSAIDGEEEGASTAAPNAYVRHTFQRQLETLRNTPKARDNPLVAAALGVIDENGAAASGVESFSTLNEWFDVRLAPRLRRVALLPEQGAGVLAYATSTLLSPLLFTRRGLVPGDDTGSIIARAEWYLGHKDLDMATREVNQLKGWAKVLASDWLDAARKRLEVDQALDLIDKEASFRSLLKT